MRFATSMLIKEKFTDGQGAPVLFNIKHDLGGFKPTDRLRIKSWKQIHALKESATRAIAKVQKKDYYRTPPNFNMYIWHKEHLLTEKAIKTGNKNTLGRATAFSELGAGHLMELHQKIKEGGYTVQTSCIIPLIALNQYVQEGKQIPLSDARIKQAAKIASELAKSCDKYSSSYAREQLPDALKVLDRFLDMTAGAKGIENERAVVRDRLEKGSPELDKMTAKEAYRALLTIGGDEGVEQCRSCILEIRNSTIKEKAMISCQEYWNSHWFNCGEPIFSVMSCKLFPKEFMDTLQRMEIQKN